MVKRFLRRIRGFLLAPILQFLSRTQQTVQTQNVRESKASQVLLSLTYKRMLHDSIPLPSFDEIGFRVLSQNDEDGILLYIFSLIGATNKKVVDIGCSSIENSNTANLIINHGWIGLLIDYDERS